MRAAAARGPLDGGVLGVGHPPEVQRERQALVLDVDPGGATVGLGLGDDRRRRRAAIARRRRGRGRSPSMRHSSPYRPWSSIAVGEVLGEVRHRAARHDRDAAEHLGEVQQHVARARQRPGVGGRRHDRRQRAVEVHEHPGGGGIAPKGLERVHRADPRAERRRVRSPDAPPHGRRAGSRSAGAGAAARLPPGHRATSASSPRSGPRTATGTRSRPPSPAQVEGEAPRTTDLRGHRASRRRRSSRPTDDGTLLEVTLTSSSSPRPAPRRCWSTGPGRCRPSSRSTACPPTSLGLPPPTRSSPPPPPRRPTGRWRSATGGTIARGHDHRRRPPRPPRRARRRAPRPWSRSTSSRCSPRTEETGGARSCSTATCARRPPPPSTWPTARCVEGRTRQRRARSTCSWRRRSAWWRPPSRRVVTYELARHAPTRLG